MHSLFALTILYNQPFVVEQILLGGMHCYFCSGRSIYFARFLPCFGCAFLDQLYHLQLHSHSAIKLNKFGFKTGWQAFPSHKNRLQLTPLQCSVFVFFLFFQNFCVHQFSHNNLCRTQFFILLYFYFFPKCLLCRALVALVLSFCTVRISRPSVSYLL